MAIDRRRRCVLSFTPLFAIALLAACSPVAPWERGNLAKPQMEPDAGSRQRPVLDHIYRSREGSAGSTSARGGGCGCY